MNLYNQLKSDFIAAKPPSLAFTMTFCLKLIIVTDHDILLKRLDYRFSICGSDFDWFRSSLTNRNQFALIEGKKKPRELKCGVPQGSVLRPILYLLYKAPLADVLRHHKMEFHFVADDTQLYISFSPNNDLSQRHCQNTGLLV